MILRWFLLNNRVIHVQCHRNIRARCEICSELAIKIPEQCYFCSSAITVNFEHAAQIRSVTLLVTLSK